MQILPLSDAEMHLYSRQILLDAWDLDAQEKLKLSNILIVGAGGIGCSSAELLARAGVGKISIIDPDHIETSNLQRQIAFAPEHVGLFKAETLVKRLRGINPHIDIDYYNTCLNPDNAAELIGQQDLVLDGCDNFSTRYLVNRVCHQTETPLISASAIGLQGQLFMTDADSACYACLFPEQDQPDNDLRCADSGVLATTPVVMAALQAHMALMYLGLGLMPLRQKLLLWDGLNATQRILKWSVDENCRVCGSKHR